MRRETPGEVGRLPGVLRSDDVLGSRAAAQSMAQALAPCSRSPAETIAPAARSMAQALAPCPLRVPARDKLEKLGGAGAPVLRPYAKLVASSSSSVTSAGSVAQEHTKRMTRRSSGST